MDASTAPPQQARATLDGDELRAALTASAVWLERHAEALNALNVFPVPDGDTGLNMSLTLRAAVDEMTNVPHAALGDVAAALAHGALMGARGNSGVILAQMMRAIAHVLDGHDLLDATLSAEALTAGADAAYLAVGKPVEGTILTVARAAAFSARAAAVDTGDVIATLERAHEAARAAVAHTPEQLPILKQAGVVDAGGEGLRVILEGILVYARGERLSEEPIPIAMRADLTALHQDSDDSYGYCTEVLFRGTGIDVGQVRERLAALGTCVLVVGDEQLLKTHVHTIRPGAVLDLATELGEIVKVKVDNMQIQHDAFTRSQDQDQPAPVTREPGTSLVAVVVGAGFERLFTSLGAVVVTGAQTMNPSVEQLLGGIERAPRDEVIIAANDPNVVLAARQAAGLAPDRRVEVLTTHGMAQGIAAALALSPDADAATNLPKLEAASRSGRVVEMARAVRDARLGELDILSGDRFTLLDGEPIATDSDPVALLAATLDRLPGGSFELATIYQGSEATAAEAEALAEVLQTRLGVQEAVVEFGGQPQFDYVIALE